MEVGKGKRGDQGEQDPSRTIVEAQEKQILQKEGLSNTVVTDLVTRMVIAMGCSSALGVRAATAATAASSPDSSLGSSLLDGAHGVRGFRAAPTMVTSNRTFEPLLNSCTPWRRELSVRRAKRKAMDVRVLASSSDETSGEKNGQVNTENVPGWAKPNSEEPPPWARNERPASQEPAQEVPFPVYLIGSVLVSIAAVRSSLWHSFLLLSLSDLSVCIHFRFAQTNRLHASFLGRTRSCE